MPIPLKDFPRWLQGIAKQMRDNAAEIQTRAAIDIGREMLERSPVVSGNFQAGFNIAETRSAALRYRRTMADSKGNVRGINFIQTLTKHKASFQRLKKSLLNGGDTWIGNAVPYGIYVPSIRAVPWTRLASETFSKSVRRSLNNGELLKNVGRPRGRG